MEHMCGKRTIYRLSSFFFDVFVARHLSFKTEWWLENFKMEVNASYLAWDYLVRNHHANTNDAAVEVQAALTSIKMKPGGSLVEFLQRRQRVRTTFANHGEAFSHEH